MLATNTQHVTVQERDRARSGQRPPKDPTHAKPGSPICRLCQSPTAPNASSPTFPDDIRAMLRVLLATPLNRATGSGLTLVSDLHELYGAEQPVVVHLCRLHHLA